MNEETKGPVRSDNGLSRIQSTWVNGKFQKLSSLKLFSQVRLNSQPPFIATVEVGQCSDKTEKRASELHVYSEGLRRTCGQIFSSSAQNNKRSAKVDVELKVLQSLGIDCREAFRVQPIRPIDSTPLAEINKLVSQMKGTFSFTDKSGDYSGYRGTLKLKDVLYEADYAYHPDKRYCKHKLALLLLRQAASNGCEEAMKSLAILEKENTLCYGMPFSLRNVNLESEEVEFKGGSGRLQPMTDSGAQNLGKKLSKTVVAFLAAKGGNMYIGVFEQYPHVVHGVFIPSAGTDAWSKKFRQTISTEVIPDPSRYLSIEFIPVRVMDSYVAKPPRPSLLDPYTEYLEVELEKLSQFLPKYPTMAQISGRDVYVVEISVQPDKTKTYTCRSSEYRRVGTETVRVSPVTSDDTKLA